MDEIRIPNVASYLPISLADLMLVGPVAARLLFRATLPGRILGTLTFGAYAGSAFLDWAQRQGVRKIDFLRHYGADVHRQDRMPREVRLRDVERLVEELNDAFVPMTIPRRELAVAANRHLTEYIAEITGQRVETSSEIREFMLAQLAFPFALGACDPLTGDIAIFQKLGVFEPHVLTHEFAHRKGYWKELEAQALAYLALMSSGDSVLVQSARCERLYRQLWVLARQDAGQDAAASGTGQGAASPGTGTLAACYRELVETAELRPELDGAFQARTPGESSFDQTVGKAMREIYELRMRLTGQGGLTDYDEGFTNFLHTIESAAA